MNTVRREQSTHAAFQEIWGQRRQQLYALCLRWMGGDRQEAEDAVGRLAIKAFEDFPSQSCAIANYNAWLTRLAYNLCVDIHRERMSYGRAMERFASERQFGGTLVTEAPDGTYLRREMHHVILRAFEDLPSGLIEVCRLRFLQGLSHEEIAAELALSNEMTRKRVQKARALLCRALLPYLSLGRAERGRPPLGMGTTTPTKRPRPRRPIHLAPALSGVSTVLARRSSRAGRQHSA
jgi:RNA polymerase sigma factor (sigma-70 family)